MTERERQRPSPPRIVVTVAATAASSDPVLAARKNELYAAAVRRHGGEPVLLDAAAPADVRSTALATMDGLLLSGGADLDPARYGQPDRGSRSVDRERDALEAEAFAAARGGGRPVLGICRGMQLMNALLGGSLEQHVEGHVGSAWDNGPPLTHQLLVAPGTRLAGLLDETTGSPGERASGPTLVVNSFHHQAVRRTGLAPDLVASATAGRGTDEVVEALEMPGDGFVVGVQCHPERTESTPAVFERLWAAFVDACRGETGTL